MSVLSKSQIEERLQHPPQQRRALVVAPRPDFAAFDADSVDLRLGTDFLLPRTLRQPFFCPDRGSSAELHVRVHVPLGRFLVVPAHQTVLGSTLEFIKLPHDVAGQIFTKSSVARMFVVMETAPWIHPEYRGCLTLEIANVSNTPVLLYPGRAIGQLVLSEVGSNAGGGQCEPALLADTYFGPVVPEAPRFKDPAEDLESLGVAKTFVYELKTVGPKTTGNSASS